MSHDATQSLKRFPKSGGFGPPGRTAGPDVRCDVVFLSAPVGMGQPVRWTPAARGMRQALFIPFANRPGDYSTQPLGRIFGRWSSRTVPAEWPSRLRTSAPGQKPS